VQPPALSPSPADAAHAMALLMAKRKASARGAVRTHADGRIYVDLGEGARVWSFPLEHRSIPLTRELAEEVLRDVRTGLEQGRELADIIADYQPRLARPNLVRTRLERWLDVKRREAAAGDRSPTYLRELERYSAPGGHFSWWNGKSVRDVNYAALEDWSHWLADRGLGPKTRWNVLAAFRSFIGWLYQRGEIREVPRRFPWPRLDEHAPATLSADAQAAVLAAIPAERRGIFLALAYLGLRPGEAVALRVVNYQAGEPGWITVSAARKGTRLDAPVRGTKSRKAKRLPVPTELAEWIERWVRRERRLEGGALFVVPYVGRGRRPVGPWTASALRRTWESACAQIGVRIALYQGTKHTMATEAIRRGVSERSLQAFLGHADVRSTRKYARLADQALIEVLACSRKVTQNQARVRRGAEKHGNALSNSAGLVVEAAGIEPASEWLPTSASTCVVPDRGRPGLSRDQESPGPAPYGSRPR